MLLTLLMTFPTGVTLWDDEDEEEEDEDEEEEDEDEEPSCFSVMMRRVLVPRIVS
jgi:hypothetical protein